jgi:hypothetical protein
MMRNMDESGARSAGAVVISPKTSPASTTEAASAESSFLTVSVEERIRVPRSSIARLLMSHECALAQDQAYMRRHLA